MIQTIDFPEKQSWTKSNEYEHHYLFIKKYAELIGIDVVMTTQNEKVFCGNSTHFSTAIDERQVFVDYSDHEPVTAKRGEIPVFKFHYSHATHGEMENIFPIGPMLDLPDIQTYNQFFRLTEERIYTCNTDLIINCQRPRNNATRRRRHVQDVLHKAYKCNVDTSFTLSTEGQFDFWNKHRNCLLAVCVPGARNNMLDRGHYEQLALGVCTVSPNIPTVLPGGQDLIPDVHYLRCADDYSDLIEIIEWCKTQREQCRQIGHNAQALFRQYCLPEPYWRWIANCLG